MIQLFNERRRVIIFLLLLSLNFSLSEPVVKVVLSTNKNLCISITRIFLPLRIDRESTVIRVFIDRDESGNFYWREFQAWKGTEI